MGTEMEREQKPAFNLSLKSFLHMLPITHGKPAMTFCLPNKMEEIVPAALFCFILCDFFIKLEGREIKSTWAKGRGRQVLCLWLDFFNMDRPTSQ